MATAKSTGNRPYQTLARQKAFAAARMMISDGKSQQQAAEAFSINRGTVGEAMLILQHGTEEEIAAVESGSAALRATWDVIVARTTPAERKKKRRSPTQTAALMQARSIDAEIWQKLREALDAITSLPSAKDTATIVRKNPMRIEHTNRKLLATLEWITEFSDEVTR